MNTSVTHPQTVLIPGGPFTMGDDNQRPDERPAHRVTVSAFRMAVLPVTNEDYARFFDACLADRQATGHEAPRFWTDPAFNHPRQPVVGVSWFDAVAYCDWLSDVAGVPDGSVGRFRLPTEAEWEKAALGGVDGAKYPWGDEPFDGPFGSRSDGRFKQGATWQVGAAPPNGYGLIDIGFNVHEWCSDWYDPGYYAYLAGRQAVSPGRDPQGPPTGERRASRGGAWRHAVKVSRCSARSSIPPEYLYNDYGFRVVQEVDPGVTDAP
ncbi:MAG: SUMF1/EgtB/PvdO family nonheme iron enzyme [Dehalococcoidia bacterium]